jgi:hypothetical protein
MELYLKISGFVVGLLGCAVVLCLAILLFDWALKQFLVYKDMWKPFINFYYQHKQREHAEKNPPEYNTDMG